MPRNMIFAEATHPKVPQIRDERYRGTVLERELERGGRGGGGSPGLERCRA